MNLLTCVTAGTMREALRRMPPELLGATIQWLSGLRNDTVDMREPQVSEPAESFKPYLNKISIYFNYVCV